MKEFVGEWDLHEQKLQRPLNRHPLYVRLVRSCVPRVGQACFTIGQVSLAGKAYGPYLVKPKKFANLLYDFGKPGLEWA
jgi:hypothetical protein